MDITTLNNSRLPRSFYEQPTLIVAKKLLNQYIVVYRNNQLKIGLITETEAYIGTDDLACHAASGITPRNQIMWGKAGHLYVYLVYGIHHLVNIITEIEGFPSAVLIRSAKPIIGFSRPATGPGLVTKILGIDKGDYGLDVTQNGEIFISESGITIPQVHTSPRIGIDYAPEPWKSLPWRFYIE